MTALTSLMVAIILNHAQFTWYFHCQSTQYRLL